MKKLLFLLSLLPMLCSWQSARADVTNLTSDDGWVRLTAMPSDDWGNYYYVIADHSQELMLQLGMGANQDKTTNTLWYQKPVDPLSDQTVLFTIEKTTSASTGTVYGILRCVAFPDYFLQTENNAAQFYHTHDNGGGDKSWARLEIKTKVSGANFEYFYMKNGKIGTTNYLGAWDDNATPTSLSAGTEIALNKPSEKQAHFQIYAIKKTDYAALQQARIEDASKEQPQDVTWYLRDPNMSLSGSKSAWTVESGTMAIGGLADNRCSEFWNCTFDVSQTLTGLPNGVYQVKAQGFYRIGGGTNDPSKAAAARGAGNEVINASFYANTASQPFPSVFDNNCTTNKGTNYVSSTGYAINGTTHYVPTTMNRASAWFSEKDYEAEPIEVVVTDGKLKLGARKSVADSQDWSIFDNFRLYYLGANQSAEQEAALAELEPYETALASRPNADFQQVVDAAKTAIQQAINSEAIATALSSVKDAYPYYLTGVEPTSEALDFTSLLKNADLRSGTAEWTLNGNWNSYSAQGNATPSALENFSSNGSTFAISQTIRLAAGTYRLRGYAFHVNNNSDSEATAKMMAADQKPTVAVQKLPTSYTIPYLAPSKMHEASEAFGAGNYLNELLFTVSANSEITLGYEGVGTGRTWFICGPMTLEKISDAVLAAEAQAEADAQLALYASRKALYTAIAAQHTDGVTIFDTDEADATSDITLLGKALTRYMNNFSETFDLTSLIVNPSFESASPMGWHYQTEGGDAGIRDNGNNIYTFSGAAGTHIFNTWIASDATTYDHYLLQRIDHLPAGTYQLTANLGSNQGDAHLRLVAGDAMTDYISCTDATSHVAATLNFDLNNAGSLRIGAKSNRWFKADDFRLLYKPYTTPSNWANVDLGTINLENEKVHAFLTNADYHRLASTSVVADYATGIYDKPATVQILWPELTVPVNTLTLTVSTQSDYSAADTRTITLDPASLRYNLANCTPGYTYYYKVEADGTQLTNGQFQTEGTVRMIATEGGSNIRDLGGRITLDGRRVKYGRIYRGGEMHQGDQTNMTEEDLREMKRLGITAELDLRNTAQTKGVAPTASAIQGANYLFVDLTDSEEALCTNAANRVKVRDAIHFIAEQLKQGNVYFHCIWGADRTGAIAFFVENILGCTTADMYKDFELTSFSKAGHRAANWHNGLNLQNNITYIQEHYEGANLQEQVVAFLKDCGVTEADINAIRTQLLEQDDAAYAQRLDDLKQELSGIITLAGATWNPEGIATLEGLRAAYNTAMNALTTEVDMTALLSNAQFTDGTTNWMVRGNVAPGGETNKCAEIFEQAASVRQTLDNMPSGTYILKAQGYQNNGGSIAESYKAYTDGTANLTSYIMLNNKQQTLRNLFEDALNGQVREGDANPALGVYAPNTLNGAADYFNRSKNTLYWNVLSSSLTGMGSLTLGAAQTAATVGTRDWTAFDNFRLYYRGASCNDATTLVLDEEAKVTLPTEDSYMTIDSQSRRTLKAGCWNTVCLPFDMTAEMMENAGITTARTLAGFENNGQTVIFEEVSEMKAGIPYLVRVSTDWSVTNMGEVLVRAKQPVRVRKTGGNMRGFYSPLQDVSSCYYVSGNDTQGNVFKYASPENPVNIRGMRATISNSNGSEVKVMNIALSEETSIQGIDAEEHSPRGIYDMSGRKLSDLPLKSGLYIVNGKKTVIK